MRSFLVLCFMLGVTVSGFSAILTVPAPFPTIQSAINAAAPAGDTVLVAPGTYTENINFLGKAVTVVSAQGNYVTFIDGNQAGSVVSFISGEGSNSVLDGFTIMNGSGTIINGYQACGGGIFCEASSPTIKCNVIVGNWVKYFGGGIYCQFDAKPLITDNLIFENVSEDDGAGISVWIGSDATITNNTIIYNHSMAGAGGMDCWSSDPELTNNIFARNDANSSGGGFRCVDHANPIITNCTFCENMVHGAASPGGGVASMSYSHITITNCIIYDNHAPVPPQEIYLWNFGTVTVTYSDVLGGYPGTGNINAPPMFVSQATDDYHLTYPSPCRDMGTPTAPALPPTDFEGDPRIAEQNPDMGADEFYTHLYCTGDFTPGGNIQAKFVGIPGTLPVTLVIGLGGARTIPLVHALGLVWLFPPYMFIPLIPIPANGVLVVNAMLPPAPPGPYYIAMQAIIGAQLSNLYILYVP